MNNTKKITAIEPKSLAHKAGIRPGDALISINGQVIADVLDYRFHLTERKITLALCRDGAQFDVAITKPEYEDIGLEFEDFLMDGQRACANRCIFCFVDQNAPDCRETLHFKDDDWRLSFLWGNYITTTNMTDADIDRIIAMRTSPMNISVHTTNPDLRVKMLANPQAAKIMDTLGRLNEAGVATNCQIVLCRGVNDGAELDRTMGELAEFYPNMQSVSVVPAGITRHREGLYPLAEYSPGEAG
ncbi:MAG: PDZ domain-containing protein, partial [Oscillospiraceae bacterium]|nr:PDZ domain-containing protein [Oscillospiraceae bacterium]